MRANRAISLGLVAVVNSETQINEMIHFCQEASIERYMFLSFESIVHKDVVLVVSKEKNAHSLLSALGLSLNTQQVLLCPNLHTSRLCNRQDLVIRDDWLSQVAFSHYTSYSTEKPILSCFVSIFSADSYLDNLIHEIDKQTYKHNIEWMIGLFTATNTEETNRKIIHFSKHLKHVKLYIFHNNHNFGLYKLWNFFIPLSSAPLLSSFHPDDVRSIHWAHLCTNALYDADIGIVTPTYIPFSSTSNPYFSTFDVAWFTLRSRFVVDDEIVTREVYKMDQCDKLSLFTSKDLFTLDSLGNISFYDIPNAAPVWRKSLHETCGYFDERDSVPADILFWLKVSQKTKMVQLHDCPVWFRQSKNQLHKKHKLSCHEMQELANRYAEPLMLKFKNRIRQNR